MLFKIQIKPRGNLHLFPPEVLQEKTRAHLSQVFNNISAAFKVEPFSESLNFYELSLEVSFCAIDDDFDHIISQLKTLLQQLYAQPILLDIDFIVEVSTVSKKAIIFHAKHDDHLSALFEKHNKQTIFNRNSDNPLDSVFRNCAASGNLEDLKQVAPFVEDINTKDTQTHKRSALHWAILNEHAQCVEFLLKNGARLDMVDADGLTPFDYYKQNHNEAISSVVSNYISNDFKITWADFINNLNVQAELNTPREKSIIGRLYLALNYCCKDDEFRAKKIYYVLSHGCKFVLVNDITQPSNEHKIYAGFYNRSENSIYFGKAFFDSPVTTPHYLSRTFSHECEHAFQRMQTEFLRYNQPSTLNEAYFEVEDSYPFYPLTVFELRKVIKLIKQGDRRLEKIYESYSEIIAGNLTFSVEDLFAFEKVCYNCFSSLHNILISHTEVLVRFNAFEETRMQIREILPRVCDKAGNIVNLDMLLQNIMDIVNHRKNPLKILRANTSLLYNGTVTTMPTMCTQVIETEINVDGKKSIKIISEDFGMGAIRRYYEALGRYNSVNIGVNVGAVAQCVEQHAAVMGELPSELLRTFYPELYEYSKKLAKKVFAAEAPNLSRKVGQASKENVFKDKPFSFLVNKLDNLRRLQKEEAQAQENLEKSDIKAEPLYRAIPSPINEFGEAHKEMMRRVLSKIGDNEGHSPGFNELNEGKYFNALQKLCNNNSSSALEMLVIVLEYKDKLSINIDQQWGSKYFGLLHLAAHSGNTAAYECLVRAGADEEILNSDLEKPSDIFVQKAPQKKLK